MVERARTNENCTKCSDSNPSVVSRERRSWRMRSVGSNKSTQRTIQVKTHSKETFVNVRAHRRKGKVTISPKAEGKAKVKVRAREKSKKREPESGPRWISGRRNWTALVWLTLVLKRKRVEFVGDVQKHKNSMRHLKWIEQLMCFAFEKFKSCMTDWMELPSSSTSGVQVSEEPADTHENLYQSTGESLFDDQCRGDRPIIVSGGVVSTCPMDYATLVPTENSP